MSIRIRSALVALGVLTSCSAIQQHAPAWSGVFSGGGDAKPLTAKEEQAIGATESSRYVHAYGGEIPSEALRSHLNLVGQRLAAHPTVRRDVVWTFHAVNARAVNHFSLPGGHVFVTRGLLQTLENEAQLAAVLAHEIAHVDARHLVKRIEKARLQGAVVKKSGEVLGGGQGLSAGVAEAAANVLQPEEEKFSPTFREAEEVAASLAALRLLDACEYRVGALLDVARILSTSEGVQDVETLATHEMTEAGLEQVKQEIQQRYDPKRGEYRRQEYEDKVLQELGS